jgi:RNA polymerase sigma factor (sigma-70 family)
MAELVRESGRAFERIECSGQLAEWVCCHEHDLLRHIRRQMSERVARHLDPEDVLQDSLVVVMRSVGRVDLPNDANARRWILAISRNVIRNAARSSRRWHDLLEDEASEGHGRDVPILGVDRATQDGYEDSDIACRRVWQLPSDARMVLVIRHLLGASWSTVAKLVDRSSEDAARKFYERCKAKLLRERSA